MEVLDDSDLWVGQPASWSKCNDEPNPISIHKRSHVGVKARQPPSVFSRRDGVRTVAGAKLKDLCSADKVRVANLIKELARISDEKEVVERKLVTERDDRFAANRLLVKRHRSVFRKHQRTQSQLLECQQLLSLYQTQLTLAHCDSVPPSPRLAAAPLQHDTTIATTENPHRNGSSLRSTLSATGQHSAAATSTRRHANTVTASGAEFPGFKTGIRLASGDTVTRGGGTFVNRIKQHLSESESQLAHELAALPRSKKSPSPPTASLTRDSRLPLPTAESNATMGDDNDNTGANRTFDVDMSQSDVQRRQKMQPTAAQVRSHTHPSRIPASDARYGFSRSDLVHQQPNDDADLPDVVDNPFLISADQVIEQQEKQTSSFRPAQIELSEQISFGFNQMDAAPRRQLEQAHRGTPLGNTNGVTTRRKEAHSRGSYNPAFVNQDSGSDAVDDFPSESISAYMALPGNHHGGDVTETPTTRNLARGDRRSMPRRRSCDISELAEADDVVVGTARATDNAAGVSSPLDRPKKWASPESSRRIGTDNISIQSSTPFLRKQSSLTPTHLLQSRDSARFHTVEQQRPETSGYVKHATTVKPVPRFDRIQSYELRRSDDDSSIEEDAILRDIFYL